jgi:hypothetical protein
MSLVLFLIGCQREIKNLPAQANQEEDDRISMNKNFVIRMVAYREPMPKDTLELILDNPGNLRNIDYHKLDDDAWPGLFKTKREPRNLRIVLEDEAHISLSTLTGVLTKLRAAANPKKEVNVFVCFHGLGE